MASFQWCLVKHHLNDDRKHSLLLGHTTHKHTTIVFYINAVKNLRNTTNTNSLQEDNAGSMEMHWNPAIITYKNTNIYKYKKNTVKEMLSQRQTEKLSQ